MRFSAWSLRVISVCSALVFVPSAWAHLSVSPTRVGVGEAVDLTFGAPNEDDALGIDHVTLTVPQGFDLDDAEAKPGWTQSRSGGAITWSGGRIPQGRVRDLRDPRDGAENGRARSPSTCSSATAPVSRSPTGSGSTW